jgi:two-component system, NtrC family, nitrogen regulation sensor histidine kinase GlnL
MLEAIPLPALAVTAAGGVCHANPAAQDLLLRSLPALQRSGLARVLDGDSALLDLVRRAWAEGAALTARDANLSGPGFGAVRADIVAAPSEDGGFVAVVIRPRGQGRDVSERGHEVTGARSMAALGQTLAHEVKNPLAGIRGAAQLLLLDAQPGQEELARLIIDETDRVRRLIDRMESFGAEAPLAFQPVNVHTLLERVSALAETGFATDIAVSRRFDPSLPDVSGDPDQLIQVFLNLAKNAAEAALARGDEGEITVTSAWRHGQRVRTADGAVRDLPVEIAFADNGKGIPADLRDCLFEPFVTSKAGGSGLGLPLVQKIVAAHGGVVDFESQPGRTVFRVRLPLTRMSQHRAKGSGAEPDGAVTSQGAARGAGSSS